MPQQALCRFEKRRAIARVAQRSGADDRDAIERYRPQALCESRHAIEAALHGCRTHHSVDRTAAAQFDESLKQFGFVDRLALAAKQTEFFKSLGVPGVDVIVSELADFFSSSSRNQPLLAVPN